MLRSYARYYNDIRTRRSLDKDAPVSRTGSIKSYAILGGLHHHYVRVRCFAFETFPRNSITRHYTNLGQLRFPAQSEFQSSTNSELSFSLSKTNEFVSAIRTNCFIPV